ncbi:MAG: hypothetical protein KAR13_11685, partial [Desulfobulbaceae bacterium]|nr:hypothetical protein [Desulfobulbaceae bacterium]
VLHGWARETIAQEYRSVLINDLTICASTLESPPVKLTIEEATHARHMWSWYLKYGRDDDPLDQARQCEHIYNALSSWRFHALFRFGETEELTSETERVVAILEKAPNVQIFIEFFSEAKRYLDVVRRTEGDGVARSCISAIADALADQFIPAGVAPQNALTSFVTTVLGQNNDNKDLAWNFAVRICRKYLRRKKETGDHSLIVKELQRLLGLTPAKAQLLYDLYSYAHPASIGIISGIELDCIFEHENEFSDMLREWFMLLGTFALVRWEMIQSRLSDRLNTMRNQPVEASRLMERFIDSLYWSVLKYKWSSIQIQTAWIIDMIVDFGLDGALFEMYEFTWLRDKSHFTLNMPQLEVLVRSRMELEQRPKPDDSFKIIPYDFRINDWCSFDETNPEEVSAFYEFCRLGLGRGFTSIHWMPKYVAQLDPSGRHVATFIEQHLKENACIGANVLARLAYLASDYPNTSEPWTTIARPICRNAERLRREEREQVYFGLSSKETGVLSSMPGEVPDHYRQRFDEAAGMFKDEPPNSPLMDYRKWNLRHAEADLKREQEYAEEDFNG